MAMLRARIHDISAGNEKISGTASIAFVGKRFHSDEWEPDLKLRDDYDYRRSAKDLYVKSRAMRNIETSSCMKGSPSRRSIFSSRVDTPNTTTIRKSTNDVTTGTHIVPTAGN